MGVLEGISTFLRSYGVDPFLGGFVAGVVVCALVRLGLVRAHDPGLTDPQNRYFSHNRMTFAREQLVDAKLRITVRGDSGERELSETESGRILDLVRSGRTVDAVELASKLGGVGLAEAKELVEILERRGR